MDAGAFKSFFGKFTRKRFKQQMFDEAVKENPAVAEALQPKDFGLKSLK